MGHFGDQISVKSGFGRNYLIPSKKAVSATKANIDLFESRRAELEVKASAKLRKANERAEKLKDLIVTIASLASEDGKLYGSVGVQEIAEALEKQGHAVEKSEVLLPEGAIRYLGEYDIQLQLSSDLFVSIKVSVAETTPS